MLLNLAFIAPDLVEAAVEGRIPPDITISEITRDLPDNWNEQRRYFGLTDRQSATG
jgi:site-specific DNA recombinase